MPKSYQRGNQNKYIKEEQTTQCLEDTKWVIRISISKKNRQHNVQKKKRKTTNSDLQNTTQKTKDRATRSPLKSRRELKCSGRVSSFCSTGVTCRVTLKYFS